ncbi:hypothetical protein VTO58DRAFT_107537 [Aureobasidium pullulans]
MRLSFERPSEARSSYYNALKSALVTLEQHGQFSTNFLGAYALLATYEVGQGVYPAAFLSVSSLVLRKPGEKLVFDGLTKLSH